jgi:hypothetical protein
MAARAANIAMSGRVAAMGMLCYLLATNQAGVMPVGVLAGLTLIGAGLAAFWALWPPEPTITRLNDQETVGGEAANREPLPEEWAGEDLSWFGVIDQPLGVGRIADMHDGDVVLVTLLPGMRDIGWKAIRVCDGFFVRLRLSERVVEETLLRLAWDDQIAVSRVWCVEDQAGEWETICRITCVFKHVRTLAKTAAVLDWLLAMPNDLDKAA